MRLLRSILIAGALAGLLAGSSALAQSNWWIGTTDGNFNQATNWSQTWVPTPTERPFFTNVSQSIQFTASVTNMPLQVYDSALTFDLNGYRWQNGGNTQYPLFDSPYNNITSGVPVTVHFSSSQGVVAPDGNYAIMGPRSGYQSSIINGPVTLLVDDALGQPVKVTFAIGAGYIGLYGTPPTPQVIVEGPGSELEFVNNGANCNTWGSILVTNGATFRWDYGMMLGMANCNMTTTVVNANMHTGGGNISGYPGYNWGGRAEVDLSDGSTWHDTGDLNVGAWEGTHGYIVLSNSTFVGQSMTLGSWQYSRGDLQILDSTATFSNRLVVSSNFYAPPATTTPGAQSRLVLKNSTIKLGGGATAGVLTNLGIMRVAGMIQGIGTSPALVYAGAGSSNWVGSSIGLLTLSNANLNLAAGSVTSWEFSDTGLDQINVVGGWAKLDGTNLFSIVGSTNGLVPGVKWGLGTYDFVLGTGVTVGANFYADITNLLSSAPYSLVYGTDYRFGWVDTGTGLQALRLAFVPEPSTVLLLVGGGLLLYRVRRRE